MVFSNFPKPSSYTLSDLIYFWQYTGRRPAFSCSLMLSYYALWLAQSHNSKLLWGNETLWLPLEVLGSFSPHHPSLEHCHSLLRRKRLFFPPKDCNLVFCVLSNYFVSVSYTLPSGSLLHGFLLLCLLQELLILLLLFPILKFPKVYSVTFSFCVLYISDSTYTHEFSSYYSVDHLAQVSSSTVSQVPLLYFLVPV